VIGPRELSSVSAGLWPWACNDDRTQSVEATGVGERRRGSWRATGPRRRLWSCVTRPSPKGLGALWIPLEVTEPYVHVETGPGAVWV
jgi:hypothetical protein